MLDTVRFIATFSNFWAMTWAAVVLGEECSDKYIEQASESVDILSCPETLPIDVGVGT